MNRVFVLLPRVFSISDLLSFLSNIVASRSTLFFCYLFLQLINIPLTHLFRITAPWPLFFHFTPTIFFLNTHPSHFPSTLSSPYPKVHNSFSQSDESRRNYYSRLWLSVQPLDCSSRARWGSFAADDVLEFNVYCELFSCLVDAKTVMEKKNLKVRSQLAFQLGNYFLWWSVECVREGCSPRF